MKQQNQDTNEIEDIYNLAGNSSEGENLFVKIIMFLGFIWLFFGVSNNIQAKNLNKLFKEEAPKASFLANKEINQKNQNHVKNTKDNANIKETIKQIEYDFYSPQKIKASKNGNVNIGVFGDSMADGVWSGLYRETGAGKNGLYKFSTHSIGLANYEYFDIAQEAKKAIKEKSIQIAIIMVGTNDQRGINGRGINVGYASTKWERNYEARILELIKIFKEENIAIYWVGLPKMRDEINDISANRLNQLFYKQAKTNNISFVSTLKASTDNKGNFSMRLQLPEENTPRNLRKSDGIHFEMEGYRLLAFPIIKMINRDLSQNGRQIIAKTDKKTK